MRIPRARVDPRRRRLHIVTVAALSAIAVGGCTPDPAPVGTAHTSGPGSATPLPATSAPTPSPSPTTTRAAARSQPLPKPAGPLAGESWPATRLPAGHLLHDDGSRLWTIDPATGERSLVWDHPEIEPVAFGLAVSPDRRRVAFATTRTVDGGHPSALYLLDADGQVVTVDTGELLIHSPVFLRPVDPDGRQDEMVRGPDNPPPSIGRPQLHWIRAAYEVDLRTHTVMTEVRRLDEGRVHTIEPLLRHMEAPFTASAYPGSSVFTVSLYRTGDTPARLEVVHNRDWGGTTAAAPDEWSTFVHRAFTSTLVGTAWLSPNEYVIPVYDDSWRGRYSLRLFRHLCEHRGSVPIYEGDDVALGIAEFTWSLVRLDADHVLVVRRDDAMEAFEAREARPDVPWYAIDVRTGELEPTGIERTFGMWTSIPDEDPGPDPTAAKYSEDCAEDDYEPMFPVITGDE